MHLDHLHHDTDSVLLTTHDTLLLDAEIHKDEHLLSLLTRRIAALKSHRNSLSPTSRLPLEVLSEIMLVASHQVIKENNERRDVYPTTLPLPLVLGQVCAAWRTLAWRLPALWSTIPLALAKGLYQRQIILLDEWLARAGEHQDLYIILTLRHEHVELQYWRDYPPEEILRRLYRRSRQWHTFYSTLPNLCFEIFAGVYDRLPRLHTLMLNRSGRIAYEVFNLTLAPGHHQQNNNNNPFIPIAITNDTADNNGDNRKIEDNPWHMLSRAPSLRSVVLPEALSPLEVSLPYAQLTHLEVRTIPLDDCLRVLRQTPQIESFDLHGIYSGPFAFVHGGHGGHVHHLFLPYLTHFSIFSDPANLARFFDVLTAPRLESIEFKSTTGGQSLSLVTSQLNQLLGRNNQSANAYGRVYQLRKLGICVPSVGRCEDVIVGFLRTGMVFSSLMLSELGGGRRRGGELRGLEEVFLESWQTDVEGLSDGFLERMNPERRVRRVRRYSYALPDNIMMEGGGGGVGDHDHDSGGDDGGGGDDDDDDMGIMDEVREVEVVDEVSEVEEMDEEDEAYEVLMPNLVKITYRGTISFELETLRNLLVARWRRKLRRRVVPRYQHHQHHQHPKPQKPSPPASPLPGRRPQLERGVSKGDMTHEEEEEEWYPTKRLRSFEIYAPEMDFKNPMDDETRRVFKELVEEGFCLKITTNRGLLEF